MPSPRRRETLNIWPGFVDALASLLMVIIFVLMAFVLTQFLLTDAISGKDKALIALEDQIALLAEDLAFERSEKQALENKFFLLENNFSILSTQQETLQIKLSETEALLATQKRAYEDQEKILKDSQAQGAALQEKLSKTFQSLQASQGQAIALEEKVTSLTKNNEILAARISSLEDLKSKLEENLSLNERTLTLRLLEMERLRQDINALTKVRQQLEADLSTLTGAQAQLRQDNMKLLSELQESQNKTLLAQEKIKQKELRIEDLLTQNNHKTSSLSKREEKIKILQQNISVLQQDIARLNNALDARESEIKKQNIQILDLGKKLNRALADKVAELAQYRSEFFGKLRAILGKRRDVKILGDRFVFQSEVLFKSGSASLGKEGQEQLSQFAESLKQIIQDIPESIDWILRIDGHTDKRPMRSNRFQSNWELSTARAISVVEYLISQGIMPERLAVAGFASFHPLENGESEASYQANRRIEIKFDQRL